jgi:amino acid adenylation domain-containing protein
MTVQKRTNTQKTDLSEAKRALLKKRLKGKGKESAKPATIPHQTYSGPVPLSFAQERLWFLEQFQPDSTAYNITSTYRLTGELNAAVLEQSLNEVVHRHEILRTTFLTVRGEPVQVIAPSLRVPLPVINLCDLPAPEREAEAKRAINQQNHWQFDLAHGPLLQVTLLQMDQAEYIFCLVMHHIITDGWSMGNFFQELSALYDAYVTGKPTSLPDLPVQYADFAVWQRKWLQGEVLENQLSYWKRQLSDSPTVLELPTDHSRPPVQTFHGAVQTVFLPDSLTALIKRLSQREGVTLFMTLLAAFNVLLYRYTGQNDIVVGSPIANRNRVETENLIGFILNTLALRTDLSGNPTFQELLTRVRGVTLGAYAHQDIPFEKLLEELQPERDLSRPPLVQVLINMLDLENITLKLPGIKTEKYSQLEPKATFDLTLYLTEQDGRIRLELVYNTSLFNPTTITWMLEHYQTLLEGIVAHPEERISKLPLLTAAKRLQLLNQNNLIHPANIPFIEFKEEQIEQSIPARFEQQVKKYPQNIAVRTKNHTWTYETLDRIADQLAQTILASGRSQAERIGLIFEHDAPMIAGMLGSLKARKIYVPLDPSYPKERLNYILEDSQANVILVDNITQPLAQELSKDTYQIINIDDLSSTAPVDNINLSISPDTIAYILYTSGSTGQPKGVMQSHRNVLHHIRVYTNNLHISPDDNLTLLSSYSFDAAVMDIFGALLNGATLYPVNLKEEGFAILARWLVEQEITIYHSTPTVYRYFVASLAEGVTLPNIRLVVLGGEEVFKKDIELYKRHFSPECIFINGLGPTESTLCLQYFINHETNIFRNTVPVGYPVENTEVVLLNEFGEEPEVYGEIAIRSPHVALGYWQKPEITQVAFLPNPEGDNERIYRTGDLGRLLPDGSIEFVGRKDSQVKIRGFRIEPGEIQTALEQHSAVLETVILVQEDESGNKRLVAYIVPNQEKVSTPGELRSFLINRLPEYMVPSVFVMLKTMPLTPTGKVDRRALPVPNQTYLNSEEMFLAPRDELELQLTKIWERLLKVQPIGIRNNFFDLGGHSLLTVTLFAEIEKIFEQALPLTTLFQAPTIEQLAIILRQEGWSASTSSLVALHAGGFKPPFFCLPGNLGNVFTDLGHLTRYLDPDQPVYGFQDGTHNPSKVEGLAAEYLTEIKSIQPTGPYLLGGICSGGVIAYEIAQQLQAQEEQVALLALVEPIMPPKPGLRSYASFSKGVFRRILQRLNHHSTTFKQLSHAEQRNFARLKTKLIANSWALRRYAPQSYPGEIDLFLSSGSLQSTPNSQLDWCNLATYARVHEIPGTHDSITGTGDTPIEEAHMRVLANKLSTRIDEISINV